MKHLDEVFKRLHMYMDVIEENQEVLNLPASDRNDLRHFSGKVGENLSILDTIAARVQSMNAPISAPSKSKVKTRPASARRRVKTRVGSKKK